MKSYFAEVMPTPTPQMNGGHRSKLPVLQSSTPSTSSSYPTNLKRTNDELRQHISRLKAELEVEKARSKQVHRNRVADIKKLKDQYDKEKLLAQTSTVDKIKTEHDLEMKKLREFLQREKEVEIKQILKFKDEELRTTKKMLAEDKEFSLKEQDEVLRREFNGKSKDSINEIENKLRLELLECKKQKQQFEELYKNKAAADSEKTELLRKLKEEHEKENQKVLRDARVQITRNVHELKIAQKALAEKEQEMTRKEMEYTRLEEEKDQLLEKVRQNGEMPEIGASKTEKEWELQLKNIELKKKVDELSRKLNLLEKEAPGGKSNGKDDDLSMKNEQRMKELRKRNGELVNLARKLEDKAKRLQEELKEMKSNDSNGRSAVIEPHSAAAFETFKKTYTVQRARDLAEHAKALMTKDREITELKKRIVDLEEQLSNSSGDVAEKEKLERIIHQIEKEKLRLEKAFADHRANEQSALDGVEVDKLKQKVKDAESEKEELEELISAQKKEIKEISIKTESLNVSREKCEELQILLAEKEEQYKILENNLTAKDQAYQALEITLVDLKGKNMETERQNEKNKVMVTTLQNKLNESTKRLVQLESLEGEYESLQERLADAEKQCVVMQSQLEIFQEKVQTFKSLEESLKENEEKCRKWERDYDFAVDKINKQNKENSELHEAQKTMQENYGLEIDRLKDEVSRLENICVDLEGKESDYKLKLQLKEDELKSIRNTPTNHVYVQTSRPDTPVQGQKERMIEDIFPDSSGMLEAELSFEDYAGLMASTDSKQNRGALHASDPNAHWKKDDDILETASSRIAALAVSSTSDGDLSREDELLVEHETEKPTEKPINARIEVPRNVKGPIKNKDISDELSLSLEELHATENIPFNDSRSLATPKHAKQRDRTAEPFARKRMQFDEGGDSYDSIFVPVPTRGSVDDSVAKDKDAIMPSHQMLTGVDKLSVFIAKYTYDPLEHSPNDDPSLELALEAGDYVYVFGDADEDGFYTGELVDGQRGLVPSNFVEKIADENELIPFANGYDAYPGDESDEDLTEVTWSCAESLNENGKDTPLDAEYFKLTPRPISTHSDVGALNDDTDLDSGDELELKQLSPPKSLKVDRQLKNSVVISWLPPDNVEPDEIQGYIIRADGELKEKVVGADKTKVIVSDINREKTCRLTVHCVGNNEKEAEGAAAVITVGRGASAAPNDLRVFNVSASSADVEWTCGNSSMAHAIYLDDNQVHVVKPGTNRFKLVNLVPDHEYEVCVEARSHGEANRVKSDESSSNGLLFRTAKAGPPEPPLNVQVRVSKPSPHLNEDFLFISWLPVTIVDAGTSKLGVVTGYKIYMNDREVLFIDQPTEDHAKILVRDVSEILANVKFEFIELWMRTQSAFGESSISNVAILPVDGMLDRGLKQNGEEIENANTVRKTSKGEGRDIIMDSDTQSASDGFDGRNIDGKRVDGKGLANIMDLEEERTADVAARVEGFAKELPVRVEKESAESAQMVGDKGISASDIELKGMKTKQAKVTRYHVTDSDESEDSNDDNESDDEDQCVFSILTDSQKAGSDSEVAGNVNKNIDVKIGASPSVPENLILPSLPIRDDATSQSDSSNKESPGYPDEVKARRHIPLIELLSSSDSELSAIEEETVEELLQYDKDGNSRPTSKSVNLLNTDGSVSRHSNENMTIETEKSMDDGKCSENLDRTFSIHSNSKDRASNHDSKKRIRSPDKLSERKGSQTSKDSLTFSSEDVIDLLDKDIMDNVPDLPRDDDKELVTATEKKRSLKVDGKIRESDVPVTDLSDLSCGDEVGEARGNRGQRKESFDIKLAGASSKGLNAQKSAGSGNLPAKQTPVESKDHNNSAMQISGRWTEEVTPAVSVQFAEREVSFQGVKPENQVASDHVALTTSEHNGLDIQVKEDGNWTENVHKQRVEPDVFGAELGNNATEVGVGSNFTGALGGTEVNEPMGQTISLNQCSVALDNTGPNGEDPVKATVTSARDLYALNAIDSFEDSESEAHADFNPYFAPVSVSKISDQENVGLGDTDSMLGDEFASSLKDEPAIENKSLTEHSGKERITSIGEAPGSNGGEATNNGDINENEQMIEDTRPNHVDEGIKPNNVRVFIALFAYDPITMSPNTDGVEEELTFAEGDLIKIFGECDEDGFYYGEVHDRCGFVPSNMVQEVSLSNFGNSFNIPPPEEDISGDTDEPASTEPQLGSFGQSQANVLTSDQQQPDKNLQKYSSSSQGAVAESGGAAEVLYAEPKENKKKMDNIITNLGNINIEDTNPDYRYISERDSIYFLPPTRMIALYDYDPAVSSPNVDSEVELPFNKGDIILVFGEMDEDGFYAAQSHNERGLVPSNFLTECPELSDSEEIEIDIGAASPSIPTSSRKSSAASVSGASPVDSPKTKKKKGLLAKGKKIFSKLKGK